MHASESLRIFVVRGQIAQSAQPFSKSYSIEERPVQTRSTPAITTTRSIWRPFLGRAQDIHQRHARREAACVGEAVESSADQTATCTVSLRQSRERAASSGGSHGGSSSILHSSRLAGRRAHQQRHGRRAHARADGTRIRDDVDSRQSSTRRAADRGRTGRSLFRPEYDSPRPYSRSKSRRGDSNLRGPSVDRVGALRDRSVNRSRRQP